MVGRRTAKRSGSGPPETGAFEAWRDGPSSTQQSDGRKGRAAKAWGEAPGPRPLRHCGRKLRVMRSVDCHSSDCAARRRSAAAQCQQQQRNRNGPRYSHREQRKRSRDTTGVAGAGQVRVIVNWEQAAPQTGSRREAFPLVQFIAYAVVVRDPEVLVGT